MQSYDKLLFGVALRPYFAFRKFFFNKILQKWNLCIPLRCVRWLQHYIYQTLPIWNLSSQCCSQSFFSFLFSDYYVDFSESFVQLSQRLSCTQECKCCCLSGHLPFAWWEWCRKNNSARLELRSVAHGVGLCRIRRRMSGRPSALDNERYFLSLRQLAEPL